MKIVVGTHTKIEIPDLKEIVTNGTGKTSAVETSFLSEFKHRLNKSDGQINNEERMRGFCLNEVHKLIRGKYQSYFEPLGGVGVTASIFGQDGVDVHLNELDDACLDVIRKNFPNWTTYQQDMFKFDYQRNFDVIFFDYNNFTIKKLLNEYRDTTDQAFAHADKFVVINDCSVFYLSRGAKSFEVYSEILGEKVENYEEFFTALKKFYKNQYPEWSLVHVIRFYASSYLVFEKAQSPELSQRLVLTEEMKAAPVVSIEYPPKTKTLI